ncbi:MULTISPECIES: ABC transporter ATP-binding protein [Arthrospira]|mgnify:CR=1 FL=1|uniref:ABC transporter ATP-binding protein n=1 Tax=Limnospira platensis NIES-46 TaxID=1236695 RepID=A0A5M3T3W1_LIMPL|nr:ABC transporter ATP-binding protein [Arthrospira platensis]AMW29403.1 long-chain fatty acid--CoA ligase [Arthrospira platensis YZ]KDR56763.1 long-chain fatty acid--CoA ligase [Arthrospira platensis str. Paraca]MBD2670018.1 ABC transporter ATP-binding protein [Arthrospira platensis FACHB-439]MBD2710762.1 ABC transporter ATP-binding protein [Arthrospira platensis FACHB-835]MDF2213384.1 ABC transporter ATP-binding protein [Arthrospira platensis NCB002]MDT9183354.1 ABC transporter ATP-binding 
MIVSEKQRTLETDWRLFLRLRDYASRHKKLLAIAIILLIPLSISSAIQPILIGQTISLIRQEPTYKFLQGLSLSAGLNLLAFLLLLTISLRFTLQAIQGYVVQTVGQKMTADIRNDLFDHVTSLAVRFFDRTPVGKLITRLTSDVDALGDVFSTGAIGIVSDLFSILVIAIAMFSLQWQLALMLVLSMFPVTAIIIYFQQQYRTANYKAREELSDLNAQLQENLIGIGVVQLFRRERYNTELFRITNQRYIKAVDKTIFYDSAVSATLEWIALIAIAAVLWFGGQQVLNQTLSFGILSTFILFAQRLFDPLRQFADKFTAIQAGLTAVERINDILNQPIEIRDPEIGKASVLPTKNSGAIGEIKFENVYFAYKNDEYVIHNLNFTIHPGEKVALVGPTGAGKSSIIRLLCRLYEPSRGRILIDGIDIRDLPQAELRRHVGVILQDGFLFAGDVKSNITLGETYTIDEIRQAAEKTNVAEFIEALPEGYDTELRERGTNLSSGQKQLLAFARVAIRDPQILVLDEATANLDVMTESLIQDALDRMLVGKTAIIIAHRLSTIKNVDRILVLQRGRLIESGSHDQLLNQGGLYASLYQLQMLGA